MDPDGVAQFRIIAQPWIEPSRDRRAQAETHIRRTFNHGAITGTGAA